MKNKSKYKTHKRIFLVVADNTSEMHQALYYAARRAATANGEVALFRCVEPLEGQLWGCLLYTSPSPRDISGSRMPSSA